MDGHCASKYNVTPLPVGLFSETTSEFQTFIVSAMIKLNIASFLNISFEIIHVEL